MLFLFSAALLRLFDEVIACRCLYGAVLGVLLGNYCPFFLPFKTDDLLSAANMCMVEDKYAYEMCINVAVGL